MKTVNLILLIIKRVLSFPLIAAFYLITMLLSWVLYCIYFIIYGGEFIMYMKKDRRKGISDVYIKLEELLTHKQPTDDDKKGN